MITSSDVRRADDRGDMTSAAMTLMKAHRMRHQLVFPIVLRLKRTSPKTFHQALGAWSIVPVALAPSVGALASLAKGSVLFASMNKMTVNWV
jgi:hypothetical protein